MDYIKQKKLIDEMQVKAISRQIVDAVSYLHNYGVVHRDLKV